MVHCCLDELHRSQASVMGNDKAGWAYVVLRTQLFMV